MCEEKHQETHDRVDKVGNKFKRLSHPFLVDIMCDGEHIISLNSDDLKIKIYKKSEGKMMRLLDLDITGDMDVSDGRAEVIFSSDNILVKRIPK